MVSYEKVREKVDLLIMFYQIYGREPKSREKFRGENIGRFLCSIRKRNTRIEPHEQKKLLAIGYRLNSLDIKKEVHKKVELLKEFYLKYNKEPVYNTIYKDVKLGVFLRNIRYNVVKLSEEDYNELLRIGYILKNKRNIEVERKLLLLIEFFNTYMRAPKQDESYKGQNIGYFWMNIKLGRVNVPEEYKIKLQELIL